MKPSQLNLNLLKILDTLLKTRSSAAAARELHISQPAVSKHLASLREHFRDPLLVRSGGSTQLTNRAEILSREASDTLARVYSLFSNIEDAGDSPAIPLRIASSNHILNTHLGRIIDSSSQIEQRISFIFLPIDENTPEKMSMGDIDLYLGQLPFPADIETREVVLKSAPIACLMSPEHPLSKAVKAEDKPLTTAELADYPMVSVATGFSASIACQQYFSDNHIKPDTQYFFHELEPALSLVKQTHALLLASPETVNQFPLGHTLVSRQLPGNVPEAKGGICWPTYWESSTTHRIIREKIIELARQVMGS